MAKWARVLGMLLVLLIASRGMVYCTGVLGMNLFSNYTKPPEYATVQQGPDEVHQLKVAEKLSDMKRPKVEDTWKFDTNSYLVIVTKGYDRYKMKEKHPAANWVFFPMYPLLIRLAHKVVTGVNPLKMGIWVSNLCLLGAVIYLYLICRLKGLLQNEALRVVFFLLIYPTSVYLSVPYTESLFLLLSCGTVYHAMRGQYLAAFVLGGLSGATRIVGFLNVCFVIGHLVLEKRTRWGWRDLRFVLYAGLSAVPILAFFLYMKALTGDFLAPVHEQSVNWYRGSTFPFAAYLNWLRQPYFMSPGGWDNGLIDFVMATAVFAVFVAHLVLHGKEMWREKKELLFFAYGALLIAVPFSSAEQMTSIPRYLMCCVPLYVYLASLTRRSELVLLCAAMLFLALNVFYTVGYFNNYFFVV